MIESSDRAPWLPEARRSQVAKNPAAGGRRQSLYVPMRDGVELAVDVYLPGRMPTGSRLPAVLHQTRYFRGIEPRRAFARLERFLDQTAPLRDRFVASGYAWVTVCARGSGASHGWRMCPWSPLEIADGAEVVDWIVAQPWSSGAVGATGVSYAGTAAEMLLVNQHPAVKAIIPRFSLFDVYPDIAFPGGIHLQGFTSRWSAFNRALDDNTLEVAMAHRLALEARALSELPRFRSSRFWTGLLATVDSQRAHRLLSAALAGLTRGVRRVDGDSGALLAAAMQERERNLDVHEAAERIAYRDDPGGIPGAPDATCDFFSPHTYVDRLGGSGAAIYSVSGWMDAAYQHAAIKRFHALRDPRHRLIIGPWEHGGNQNTSPFCPSYGTGFDHGGDMIRFFDFHLRGMDNGVASDPPVRYFTLGEEQWKSAPDWPPPECQRMRLYLHRERKLGRERPSPESDRGADEYAVDGDLGSGRRGRWDSLLGLRTPVGYGDRAELSRRMLVYRSEPLDVAIEVTGHPIARLWMSADRDDAYVFAYLQDEDERGRVEHVSEGLLRAACRELCPGTDPDARPPQRSFERGSARPLVPGQPARLIFELLPISYLFARGHRIRLALAGADRDHFAVLPGAPTLAFHRGGPEPAHIELPAIPR